MSAPGTAAPVQPTRNRRDDASFRVEVPASSANLGPGFDAFAVALGMHLVAWTVEAGPQRVRCSGEGAHELPTDERNLVWQAFTAFCRHAGVDTPDLSIATRNAIPLERGLGSSAAAAVAGVALARAVTGVRAPNQTLIDLVTEVEGHADNAAAAVLGGLVVCEGGRSRRLEPSRSLAPVVFIPTSRQSTTASRARLPASVPLADAAANSARAALVLAALAGVIAWDPALLHDVLHEPARFEAMAATGALVTRLRSAGIGACLSGSGPTVLAVVPAGLADGLRRNEDETLATVAGSGWVIRNPGWDSAGALVRPGAAQR